MPASEILNGDWTDYNDRKIANGQDILKFSCNDGWEVNFLVNKIRLAYPICSEKDIRKAVASCCNIVITGRREEIVSCVMRSLEI